MNTKYVRLTTNAAGAASVDIRLTGQILAVAFDIGDLSTPDLSVTDVTTGDIVVAETGLAADKNYYPRRLVQLATTGADIAATYEQPTVIGTLRAAVAGGGDTKTGYLRVAYR